MNGILEKVNAQAGQAGLVQVARFVTFVQIMFATWRALNKAGFVPDMGTVAREMLVSAQRQTVNAVTQAVRPREDSLRYLPAVALSGLGLPLGLRADGKYRGMPELAPRGRDAGLKKEHAPSISIVVPARDEAMNLRRLLPTLTGLDYPGFVEVIVVDDQSSDGTRAVAEGFGARVVAVTELPAGWHGKPYACHLGAREAKGEWLLFTDADTMHQAESAAHTVAFATDQMLDGVTLFLKQKPRNVFEAAVLTTAFAGLFAGVRDTDDLMNGQYILLKRAVYEASGGFEAVRGESLEDLALGNRLRKLGYMVMAVRGENAAAVQMYASSSQMWHGMTRLGAGSLKWSGAGGVVTALFTTALVSPLLVLGGVILGKVRFAWLLAAWIMASASVIPFARQFGSAWLALLAPFGALFVLCAAVWGLVKRVLGGG